ncbi:hypothetical protein MTO96_020595 [Rhipicephalus appendiculatus]
MLHVRRLNHASLAFAEEDAAAGASSETHHLSLPVAARATCPPSPAALKEARGQEHPVDVPEGSGRCTARRPPCLKVRRAVPGPAFVLASCLLRVPWRTAPRSPEPRRPSSAAVSRVLHFHETYFGFPKRYRHSKRSTCYPVVGIYPLKDIIWR